MTEHEYRVALSWSGGKDSALALWTLRSDSATVPMALITTVTDSYQRISMHGVRLQLLARQALATGLRLIQIPIPARCPNALYEQRTDGALRSPSLREVTAIAYGDLFLADVRDYRERRLAAIGKQGLFPLWNRDTTALAHEFIDAGFRALIVCVDPTKLDPSFAGRSFDRELLADLPAGVDPCGENGEFHTFVLAGPIFTEPIACTTGEVVERDGFVFCDVLPESGVPA